MKRDSRVVMNISKTALKGFGLLLFLVAALFPARYVSSAYGYMPALCVLFLLLLSIIYLTVLRRNIGFEATREELTCLRGE